MYRAIALPNGRTFVIGGSRDVNSATTVKSTKEIIDGKLVDRAPMWVARSGFGLAVYPNYSQIFIAGGKINENESTKHCERYIVANDTWKRLPELREPKFSTSLCFFNNGGTLYCFGGLYQNSLSQLMPTASIERLSKGQNNWQLLNLKLPTTHFDLGAL
jgi:N-acetylneuraminic acid mutarotase